MTVQTTTNKADFPGTGSTGPFTFNFRFFENADIEVIRTVIATGTETILTEGGGADGYVLTGASSYNGGSVTLNTALGNGTEALTVRRVLSVRQGTSLRNQGSYFAELHEDMADRNTMVDQQQDEQIARSLQVQKSSDLADLIIPETFSADTRANKVIAFDDLGNLVLRAAQAGTSLVELAAAAGASLIGFLQGGTGAGKRTMQSKERDIVSVKDFEVSSGVNVAGDGTDEYVGIQRGITYAGSIQADLFFPPTAAGYKSNTGLSSSVPVGLRGAPGSFLFTSADITLLSLPVIAASNSVIDTLQIIGPGTGTSTKPGIKLTNVNNAKMRNVECRGFDKGVLFAAGAIAPQSCYLNKMEDCRIISNGTVNIEGEANTNGLMLSGCTIGGGPCATGLKLVDSNSLTVVGGDAEGLTLTVFDLDATSTLQAGHTITGFHFEDNTSSAGDVRIGNTAAVNGVTLVGCLYKPGAGNDCAINAIRGDGLTVIGGVLHSGYSGVSFRRIDAAFGDYFIKGVASWDDESSQPATTAFTPTDASGAGLVVSAEGRYETDGKRVTGRMIVTYPVTADGSNSLIGSLPVTAANVPANRGGAVVAWTDKGAVVYALLVENTDTIRLYDASGARLTNANLSGKTVNLQLDYVRA